MRSVDRDLRHRRLDSIERFAARVAGPVVDSRTPDRSDE